MELLPIAQDAQGNLVVLHDGDPLVVHIPPQGGYVFYAGVAARNLEACGVQVTADLIDPASGQAMTGLDMRVTNLVEPRNGFYWPAGVFGVANIPACPDALHLGVVNRRAILRMDVLDAQGRGARLELPVTPACPPGDSRCACICGPDAGRC
jgi:hypothetical protein